MPVNTASAAFHITPVVLSTFFSHYKRKANRSKGGKEDPQDDMLYDQAFHIVKAFIRLGGHSTVGSLQTFTNTHIPSPCQVVESPVLIPLSSCNNAADDLVKWFGPDDLRRIVGGQKWWQVRGLDGLEAEWVTERSFLSRVKITTADAGQKLSQQEVFFAKMDQLEPVMLYIHGGGYFWGSINTHRYQIPRYTRNFGGRAFTVNYRKAPQFPWPCAIQDVLAAYLYLIEPPENALHKPIAPNKITLAGDSAGGGLCLALLTILRDLSKPLPAGAVLISPWVDLTHSFPSILSNMETDIIPEHGFLSKPSTLWPVDLLPPEAGRITPKKPASPPAPDEVDVLKKPNYRQCNTANDQTETTSHQPVEAQEEMTTPAPGDVINTVSTIPRDFFTTQQLGGDDLKSGSKGVEARGPTSPEILMESPCATPLKLQSQIQLYATNEQLTHPLVSPVFQGSLGNLPPLYIIAGDNELLRDEIIYLAHRAAYPQDYPTREGVLHESLRQKENVAKFNKGTKVHLQVLDGMCHVPTVFSFAPNVRCAYHSIADFIKHVTQHSAEEIEDAPFPKLQGHATAFSSCSGGSEECTRYPIRPEQDSPGNEALKEGAYDLEFQGAHQFEFRNKPQHQNNVQMIRERVDIRGCPRPMEPVDDVPALKLEASQLGVLKEAPVMRWKNGQDEWDQRYKKAAISAMKERRRQEAKAQRLILQAHQRGFLHTLPADLESAFPETLSAPSEPVPISTGLQTPVGQQQDKRRWGPLDLDDESPPRSAIAKRRDTPEALVLLKKHIYLTPPVTHETVPSMKHGGAPRASAHPHNDPDRSPKQSVSEQQHKAHILPGHGLHLWEKIITYFSHKIPSKRRI